MTMSAAIANLKTRMSPLYPARRDRALVRKTRAAALAIIATQLARCKRRADLFERFLRLPSRRAGNPAMGGTLVLMCDKKEVPAR